jgi:arabinose-5-phosphate isomerase
MDFNKIAQEVLDTEANELINASKNISDFDLEKAIELIVNCKGKLIVTGVGKSGLFPTSY